MDESVIVTAVAHVVFALSVGFQLTLPDELQSMLLQIFVRLKPLSMVPWDSEANAIWALTTSANAHVTNITWFLLMDWELCFRKRRSFEVERYQRAARLWPEWKWKSDRTMSKQ